MSSLNQQVNVVKVKVSGDSTVEVLTVANQIRDLFTPNVSMSDVQRSMPKGVHVFLSVYIGDVEDSVDLWKKFGRRDGRPPY